MHKKVVISVSESDCRHLQNLADEVGRSRSGYLRRLIVLYLRHIAQHPEAKIK